MSGRLQRLFNIRREEAGAVLLAALFFFCVLTALMVLRPAREALGMQRGIESVRWLFMATAVVTLLVNPPFAWLVSRLPRLRFITVTFGFFAVCLLVFHRVMVAAPGAIGAASGQIFYVWFSVFNLFATMLFWALMADRFSLEQSRRLFPPIAIGGTCGAVFGPWLASVLARPLGTPGLLLVATAFLLMSVLAASTISRRQSCAPAAAVRGEAVIGGSAWAGFRAVCRSPYLLGIAAYVVILAIVATLIYFTRLQLVAARGADLDLRTTLFANLDMYTQLATLLLQAVVAGHLMRRLGVHAALLVLSLTVALGFAGLALIGSFAALIALEATFRAVQRAIMRPARETLFTVVSREDKYKAKAFIDTFVYRGGDVAGAQVEGLLGRLGPGLGALAAFALPLAVLWGVLGLWLGWAQQRRDPR